MHLLKGKTTIFLICEWVQWSPWLITDRLPKSCFADKDLDDWETIGSNMKVVDREENESVKYDSTFKPCKSTAMWHDRKMREWRTWLHGQWLPAYPSFIFMKNRKLLSATDFERGLEDAWRLTEDGAVHSQLNYGRLWWICSAVIHWFETQFHLQADASNFMTQDFTKLMGDCREMKIQMQLLCFVFTMSGTLIKAFTLHCRRTRTFYAKPLPEGYISGTILPPNLTPSNIWAATTTLGKCMATLYADAKQRI